MYNTLEGLDYGVDYMHITDDGSAISLIQEDVATMLGLQAVVKPMLDDGIGGQQKQAQLLVDSFYSGTPNSNETSESPRTSPRMTSPRRDIDLAML